MHFQKHLVNSKYFLNLAFPNYKSKFLHNTTTNLAIPQKIRFFLYTLSDYLSEVLKKITKSLL
ncbi:MAG: hypothetical protein A3H37_09160 [Candidatus Schekmanbacteria bacterium RIFCSPLOWO2_02_FULL_38_14]|uniref:Uncharacterized protein n=1 Tax=Candidatus Schekmanbacteria bacterium RIFCSPLOWO2_12_FULL_38_15 TaxID=1817883 RepID=A0A1F7SLI5_9BACT|nr:MAG: hypothetical protein A3H37_09160 [Candidatus Schekmanbacteria bacterium RIFCSPLOWO2_02_FULL_38_14]OGL54621.1 MAG: hypothetical protein A3G31_12125 [Candidatus Schekmanbacteria bacterium RIFCSPLOWO2_12_FULL_38_15]